MSNLKRKRYEELYRLTESDDAEYTDEQLTERIRLYYELNPEDQYWRDTSPNLTPRDVWGVDTSCYDS
jgi:hypothetical protein